MLFVITCTLGCDALHSFRRTLQGDLTQFAETARRLPALDRTKTFDSLAKAVACKRKTECNRPETRCAEGRGRDDFANTQLYLLEPFGHESKNFVISILAFPLPGSGKPTAIARSQLGEPTGYTNDNKAGWQLRCGILTADDTSLRIEGPPSDPHDLIEVKREPALPSRDEALQRLRMSAQRRGGTPGSRSSPEKLVSLMVERGSLGGETCVGNLAIDGREFCMGRGFNDTSQSNLEFIHVSAVTRKQLGSSFEEAVALLGEVVGPAALQVAKTAVTRAGQERFTAYRSGNFAVTITQQNEPGDPWVFQHILVWRRVCLNNWREEEMRSAWTAPSKITQDE